MPTITVPAFQIGRLARMDGAPQPGQAAQVACPADERGRPLDRVGTLPVGSALGGTLGTVIGQPHPALTPP